MTGYKIKWNCFYLFLNYFLRLNDLGSEREYSVKMKEINNMKKKLKSMLKKPVVPKIFTGSYPTKSGKLIHPLSTG